MKKTIISLLLFLLLSANTAFSQINLDSLFNFGKNVLDVIRENTELTDSEETEFGDMLGGEFNKQHTLTSTGKEKVEIIGNNISNYVKRKAIGYKFNVMKDEIKNAFSMAGGNIWITSGLLNLVENDDELAFVIAHEMAHEDKKHNMKRIQMIYRAYQFGGEDAAQLASIVQNLLMTPFEKYQEFEADEYGAYLLRHAGYNTNGAITFFNKLASLEKETSEDEIGYLFRTHPYTKDRIKRLKDYIIKLDK